MDKVRHEAMTPLNLDQTLSYLRECMPAPFDLPQLAHLCRNGQLTPLFSYNDFALDYHEYLELRKDELEFSLLGYLTSQELISVIESNKSVHASIATVYECTNSTSDYLTDEIRQSMKGRIVLLLANEFNDARYQNDENYTVFTKKDGVTLTRNDLLFDREQLESITGNDETAKLHARIAELESELSQLKTGEAKPLPVIDEYTTPAMQAMSAVINKFWANYTPDKIPPKQNSVIDWIMENYEFSRNLSLAIEQVARPESAKTGGNKAI